MPSSPLVPPFLFLWWQMIDMRGRLIGLRGVVDKLKADKSRLNSRLAELRWVVAERDSQDHMTVEKLRAGECVIDALQVRRVDAHG